ncbi:hypothetical protein Tco_0720261 [Tanacetum coccineum]
MLYCNYLKNLEGYTLKQLKGFKFEVIKDMFNNAFKRVNTFVDYKTELVEGSEKRANDKARMKELMNIVPDEEEVSIDTIPLDTKPPCIVDWKIIKKGKISQFQIIRADVSSKSTLSEVAIYAYLYAGREKVSPYTCNNNRHAQQEASS